VAVFGPTDPALWAPRGPHVAVVQWPVPCQPCTWEAMWACAHRSCLLDLRAAVVAEAAARCFGLALPAGRQLQSASDSVPADH
jgi:hypothetical protein